MPSERRKLSFATLDDVVADVENLQAKGYDRAGNWDLAQACVHLSEWMRFPIEGYRIPLLMRPFLWLARNTVGPKWFRKTLAEGMPSGRPTVPATVPKSGGDPTAAIAKLKAAVAQFATHTGPIHRSPVFGPMSKDDAMRLQLRHCEHHLSFLIPQS